MKLHCHPLLLLPNILFQLLLPSSVHAWSGAGTQNPTSSRNQFLLRSFAYTGASFSSFIAAATTRPSDANALSDALLPSSATQSNPRYLDSEIQMKYANGPDGNPRTRGLLVRRFTGDNTPWEFPIQPVSLVKTWPASPPFQPENFLRADQQDDGSFYAIPRFVYHIDEAAVASLTQYYRKTIPANSSILDICSSWVSHYPLEFPKVMKRISGTGMNALELAANDQLTDYVPKNLNIDPTLPFPDETFDVVTCVVSIDYLIHPIEVLKEVHRVLKPGGKVIVSQSNRCFPSKAIAMWLQMNDRQHLELINGYFQYAGGFRERKAFDITAKGGNANEYRDPMFIVEAVKQ